MSDYVTSEGKKYEQNLIGQTVDVGTNVNIYFEPVRLHESSDSTPYIDGDKGFLTKSEKLRVSGTIRIAGDTYLLLDKNGDYIHCDKVSLFAICVSLSDVTIGGVSRLLSHLYQAFTRLVVNA